LISAYFIEYFSRHRGIPILILRVALGGLFIYTSLHKIRNVVRFKDAVVNYEILPYWIVNIAAITIPWLEFMIGLLLIAGVLVRACAIVNCSLLLLFNAAIGINIIRGIEIYCGCFSEGDLSSLTNYSHILFNTVWLAVGIILFFLERRRFSHRFLYNIFIH
jgi:uncharacterized membrane protein YphA (DoxX/SURF4 family)